MQVYIGRNKSGKFAGWFKVGPRHSNYHDAATWAAANLGAEDYRIDP